MSKKLISIHTGDIHLTDHKPIARTDEPDWYEAQFRVLRWLMKYNDRRGFVSIGGDLFDSPSVSFKLLNNCQRYLSSEYCIAVIGNHEQPNNNQVGVDGSVFVTGSLMNLYKGIIKPEIIYIGGIAFGFIPASNSDEFFMDAVQKLQEADIIVMHKFVWFTEGDKIKSALQDSYAPNIANLFPNAKVIFTSDNHHSFQCEDTTPRVYNCGMLIRDNANLMDYKPCVFLLYDDFSVEKVDVPIEEDLITNRHLVSAKNKDAVEALFIQSLRSSGDISLSFYDNLVNRLDNQRAKDYIINKYNSIKE